MNEMLSVAIAKDGAEARLALTRAEAEHCARLEGSAHRRDFRAGRLAAKRAVSGMGLRQPYHRIQVSSLADGAPRVGILDRRGLERPADGRLSISHRDGLAVAVVAPAGVRVGVDLERSGSVPLQAVRYFLTPTEREMAESIDPTVLWSVKEAAWKALGLGRSLPFAAMEVRADDHGRPLGVTVREMFVPMHTQLSRPWPGFHFVAVWTTGGVA